MYCVHQPSLRWCFGLQNLSVPASIGEEGFRVNPGILVHSGGIMCMPFSCASSRHNACMCVCEEGANSSPSLLISPRIVLPQPGALWMFQTTSPINPQSPSHHCLWPGMLGIVVQNTQTAPGWGEGWCMCVYCYLSHPEIT